MINEDVSSVMLVLFSQLLLTKSLDQYISLLYCIMHSLTFAWGEHRLLKPLEGTLMSCAHDSEFF